jgi:hypothetical protein
MIATLRSGGARPQSGESRKPWPGVSPMGTVKRPVTSSHRGARRGAACWGAPRRATDRPAPSPDRRARGAVGNARNSCPCATSRTARTGCAASRRSARAGTRRIGPPIVNRRVPPMNVASMQLVFACTPSAGPTLSPRGAFAVPVTPLAAAAAMPCAPADSRFAGDRGPPLARLSPCCHEGSRTTSGTAPRLPVRRKRGSVPQGTGAAAVSVASRSEPCEGLGWLVTVSSPARPLFLRRGSARSRSDHQVRVAPTPHGCHPRTMTTGFPLSPRFSRRRGHRPRRRVRFQAARRAGRAGTPTVR